MRCVPCKVGLVKCFITFCYYSLLRLSRSHKMSEALSKENKCYFIIQFQKKGTNYQVTILKTIFLLYDLPCIKNYILFLPHYKSQLKLFYFHMTSMFLYLFFDYLKHIYPKMGKSLDERNTCQYVRGKWNTCQFVEDQWNVSV